jgi:hypothetical protein
MIATLLALVMAEPVAGAQAAHDLTLPSVSEVAECKATGPDWQRLQAMIDADVQLVGTKAHGWALVSPSDPDMKRYHLDAPVTIFGLTVQDVAFTANGAFAITEIEDPAAFAKGLGIDSDNWVGYAVALPSVNGGQEAGDVGGTFLGEGRVTRSRGKDLETGLPFEYRHVITMFDRYSLPGKVFVGCTYAGWIAGR